MPTTVLWVEGTAPGRLGVMPRPDGARLSDELDGFREQGVDLLVSLLPPAEAKARGLSEELIEAIRRGQPVATLPIGDFGLPASDSEAGSLINALAQLVRAGKSVAIHCHAGIGRTGTIASAVLCAAEPGLAPDEAFARVSAARGYASPETEAQRAWVRRFAEGRGEAGS